MIERTNQAISFCAIVISERVLSVVSHKTSQNIF